MLLSSLIDAGARLEDVRSALSTITEIQGEWELSASRVMRSAGTYRRFVHETTILLHLRPSSHLHTLYTLYTYTPIHLYTYIPPQA